ncbi:MAG: oxidoreductase [Rhodospirillaceae bacterium]|nr:oxidoreductase [Rhodospirillaceae bacterium]|tara:strand:- start:498 stop:1394 length:897 start_codon:yes stop_codon:yes gene_type:complete
MSLSVGVIGLGIMGGSFARNLLADGQTVTGFDIREDNVTSIVKLGGQAGVSPEDVASRVDVVITSLPTVRAFHEVMTGENGLAAAAKDGLIVIECSTFPIAEKQVGHDALKAVGTIMLDCPISGTGAQAVNKDLSVYGSGSEDAFNKCQSVFKGFANYAFYVGEFGNGSKMKFVANHLVHVHNVASAEAMVLGMKAGLDPQTIFDVIKVGAGNSRIFELRAPMMVEDDYSKATMKMEVWLKDMTTIGEFASELNCPTPLFTAGRDVYQSGLAKGMHGLDTASVCRVLEEYAGYERDKD